MKILHVDPETAFGGGERQVLGLLRHLARRGNENLLAAPPGSPLAAMVPAADARPVPLSIRNHLDLLAALRLRRIAARERPDLIHFHTSRAHAMSPWLGRSRAVVTRRMDYRIRRGPWSDRLYNRSVAGVIAISEGVRRQLVAGGVRPERIRVIHSGVEVPAALPGAAGRRAARERFAASDGPVVAVVAALERRKGHDVLLQALSRLREKGARLRCLFCGDGSERSNLERIGLELGLSETLTFLGERRQVADVLAAADLFVLPSRHEGLGVAVLEAMAMALPVVATSVGGIPEVVEQAQTGLLVPREDPGALAEAIGRLIADPESARAMGERGRERVLREFTMQRMAAETARFYDDLVEVA